MMFRLPLSSKEITFLSPHYIKLYCVFASFLRFSVCLLSYKLLNNHVDLSSHIYKSIRIWCLTLISWIMEKALSDLLYVI